MRLVVDAEMGSRGVEVRVVAQAGEDIEHFPALGGGMADTACGQQWEAVCCGQVLKGLIPAGFATEALTLDLDVDLVATKGLEESAQGRVGIPAASNGSQGRAFSVTAEGDEA